MGPWSTTDFEVGLWLRSILPRRRSGELSSRARRDPGKVADAADEPFSPLDVLADQERKALEVADKLRTLFLSEPRDHVPPTDHELSRLTWALWAEDRVQRDRERRAWEKFQLARSARRERQAAFLGWIVLALLTLHGGQLVLSGEVTTLHLWHLLPW